MGVPVLVDIGLFLGLFFGGLGILLAGLGVMKWGNAQEAKAKRGDS